jgi:hypothetical protein
VGKATSHASIPPFGPVVITLRAHPPVPKVALFGDGGSSRWRLATHLTASLARVPRASPGPLWRAAPETAMRRTTVTDDAGVREAMPATRGGEHGDIRAAMPRLVDQAGPASIPSRTWLTPGPSSQKGSTSHQLVAR